MADSDNNHLDEIDSYISYYIDIIPERDVTVIQDPTSVWLLKPNEMGELRLYEQWEQHRRFRAKAVHHDTVHGDFYLKNSDDPYGVKVIDTDSPLDTVDDELDLAPERPGTRYQLGPDENIWTLATKHKLSATKLIDHNEITNPNSIKAGMWVYIPKPEPKERQRVEYKELKSPRQMHVTVDGGTTKWTFGMVRKQSDIKKDVKHYNENHNVEIHGIAQVPVDGVTLAFYMDKHDFGSFSTSERVNYTRGFNWQHLKDGYIKTKKEVKLDTIVADAMREDDRPKATPAIAPVTVPEAPEAPVVIEVVETPPEPIEPTVLVEEVAPMDMYKDTFRYLNFEESPERYKMLESMDVRELDGAKEPIYCKEGSSVMVSGWFTYQGTPYYRVATRYWYAIPTQFAYSVENEPFNFGVDLPTRVAYGGQLTKEERRIKLLAQTVAKYNKAGQLTRKLSKTLRHK